MPLDDFLRALPNADGGGLHPIGIMAMCWTQAPSGSKPSWTVSGGFPLNLDYEACYERRIRVLSAAPGFARQVAEFSLGLGHRLRSADCPAMTD